MEQHPGDISFFAQTNFRNQRRRFGIRQADRFSHIYVIGKTGTGKTTLLETLIRQDMLAGRGLALIDPHGDLAERLAASVPESRQADCIYFNAPAPDQPFGYNPLRRVRADKVPLAVPGVRRTVVPLHAGRNLPRGTVRAIITQAGLTPEDFLKLL